MFEDGLSYPFEGDEAVKNLLIGGLLNALGFLLLPVLVVYGYAVACMRTTVQGYDQAPVFQDWGTLLVDGVKALVIGLVYSIVPLLIFTVLVTVLGVVGGDSGIVGGLSLIGILLLFLVYMVIAYLVPAAVANFAVNDSIGAGFDFETITTVITHGSYLKAFVLAIAAYFVVNIIATILTFTIIGLVLLPWVAFYMLVALSRMYGRAYAEATRGGGRTGTAAGDRGVRAD